MNLSYWEIKTWLSHVDYAVVGSGIVGLTCALELRKQHPKAHILILEKGMLPQGASTKNAGFACFGSLSELLQDLEHHTTEETVLLLKKRVKGLKRLREILGDKAIGYKHYGGYELFLKSDQAIYQNCKTQITSINQLLKPIFKENVFSFKKNTFGFRGIQDNLGFNKYEGQIDTGKMMDALLNKALKSNIKILNNCEVEAIEENTSEVCIKTKNFDLTSRKVCIATNGFAHKLIKETVRPARAQVVITKPIQDLRFKGTFHLDQGYYYFRNIDNRILLGGGRHLDFIAEETTEFGQTPLIQNQLEQLLKTTVIPNVEFEIDYRWSGIMGVGPQKNPVIKPLGNHVFCGVRLGGMGIAIGGSVGYDLAQLCLS